MTVKAIQKKRAANILRSYAEGIHAELEKVKSLPGDHSDQEMMLTVQLEANLARVALLHKQADLLRHQATLAKNRLNTVHSGTGHSTILNPDCNMLKIGPLFYSALSDDINHKDRIPLMAKLNGNSLMIYHERKPQFTFYLVDMELPARPVENAPSCFTFIYRGAEQALCAGTETSCHTWMNALTEAWFCRNEGIKGTMVNKNSGKGDSDEENNSVDEDEKDHKKVDREGDEDDSEDHDEEEDEDEDAEKHHGSKDKSDAKAGKKASNDNIMKHALKQPDKGLINMEVYVDKKNKTHMLVNGKEKPVSATSDIINIKEILGDLGTKGGSNETSADHKSPVAT
uniref:PH domain-containing protein n=2 Tax=Babesia bovis TaxID=5865 RepID=A7ASY2_BABBO|eukprot:XP_001609611.1 hypothetical protein [Babesia bovis T2Bo]